VSVTALGFDAIYTPAFDDHDFTKLGLSGWCRTSAVKGEGTTTLYRIIDIIVVRPKNWR
jgi:hypothetical protein